MNRISDDFVRWFVATTVVCLVLLAWSTYQKIRHKTEHRGTVEACLGSRCFDHERESPLIQKTHHHIKSRVLRAEAYRVTRLVKLSNDEFRCLAENVYREARGEPLIGMIAVAQITHNRVKSKRWGKSFCDVVYARKQFSWTNITSRLIPPHGRDWIRSKSAAKQYINGTRVTHLSQADHYHKITVNPYWNKSMAAKVVVGQHIFYASK